NGGDGNGARYLLMAPNTPSRNSRKTQPTRMAENGTADIELSSIEHLQSEVMKRRDLERYLRDHGCVKVREGGNHTIWSNPRVTGTAAVPRHTEIKNGVVRDICA